ncbi:MAG: biotin transporter BioY [Frisingicoccus sp.]|nr:biotin transporter BioY [Frisingicoccus sp.]
MKQTANAIEHPSKIQTMTMVALMTAVTCVLAPFSIPIGPVPISFTNLAIYLSLYLLGWKMGTASCLLYILIGMVGMPVFSGFSGGIGKLLGPTGGYIIGFIPMAIIGGILIEKFKNRWLQFGALVIGTAACYLLGTAWFCFVMDSTVGAALSLCVIPFIPADIVKIIMALVLGPVLKRTLKQARGGM